MNNLNDPQLRDRCASQLLESTQQVRQLKAFVGLDGFVDEILHVVDKREGVDKYTRLKTIREYAERLSEAAGQSTNIELVGQLAKLGGNGPIMANALGNFGVQTTYLGLLGYPALHPVFEEFSHHAELFSIGEPGRTDALEFEDGKIMMGKTQPLNEMNWENIRLRFGVEKLIAKWNDSNFVGLVNWTMLTRMNDIWRAVLAEVCPHLKGEARKFFVDLCDPEKRTDEDILAMLRLLEEFQKYFDVILGLNEREACKIGTVLGLDVVDRSPEGLCKLALKIEQRVPLSSIVVHPTAYALTVSKGVASLVDGPFTPKPRITTGAGDHFNSGFCLGKLLGFDDATCLLTGVSTSGFYVRTAKSPTLTDLADLLRNWPV